ncbi:hypothetical protein KsCSTR_30670 [Candidatus Kuenenia stuttgartiensis]|uniref:Uncharacterized protein n=1 Tax=Kuenenia stuttgartiensis TaxID=174633 RepID=A0A6G7GSA6_KUEST|nr:hypothetical protein KsCSTR_30670 [Candidatus Kuenenia stuttgartiensis]
MVLYCKGSQIEISKLDLTFVDINSYSISEITFCELLEYILLCHLVHFSIAITTQCFRCKKNFNTIDIVMVDSNSSFPDAVNLLKSVLPQYINST